ncbi:hypothetical protein PR048_012209 [Dryococelus australis]|uniref:Uncharacterized protein n=1 Tax=Dryococelus australis TaxID=614101 RepID=A0ABQ9HNR0_9NEOP|nr:hypothetical protein PR048_012209 [Dryococelus australis]
MSTRQRSAARKKLQSYGTQQNRGSPKKEDLVLHVQHEIEQLLREAAERKARTTLAFLNKGNTKTSNDASAQAGTSTRSVQNVECAGQAGTSAQNVQNTEFADQDGTTHQQSRDQDDDDPQLAGAPKQKTQPLVFSDDEDEVTSNSTPSAMRPTPVKDIMKEKIAKLRVELDLTERHKKSLVADGTKHKKARKLRREINGYEKKLKLRKNRELPPAGPGHPHLEEEQSELLKAVVDLAMFGVSAEERHHCEIVRSVHMLSELTDKLIELGFSISRSATYIRLLPRRTDTREAKCHVVTVPVKLSHPEADHHKAHQDQYFCVASIRSLETVASVLDPHSMNFLSHDDKACVPIGLIAENKQAPLVMHIEFKVSLPDHDFPNEMGWPEAVSYSGPTYIAIRSGKHSSSTATSLAQDLGILLTLEPFNNFMKNGDEPMISQSDRTCCRVLKKYDLDAIFIVTNAPGRSAFNRVERRMAPLSQELTGVVLPHDSFGTHLDSNGRTVDCALPEVVVKYIDPNNDTSNVPDLPSEEWYAEHVRENQYLLQICSNL